MIPIIPPPELAPALASLQADPGDRLARAAVLDILRENGRGELDWPKRAKDAPPELRPFFFPERPWPVEKVRVQMQFWLDYGRALAAWWPVVLVEVADRDPAWFARYGGVPSWVWNTKGNALFLRGNALPEEIVACMDGDMQPGLSKHARAYPSRDDAFSALSAACIRWARIPADDPLTK
jgi:hypothetical protein